MMVRWTSLAFPVFGSFPWTSHPLTSEGQPGQAVEVREQDGAIVAYKVAIVDPLEAVEDG